MSVVVMKFGGTSIATPRLILSAARKIAQEKRKHDVVVVVSAMGQATDELLARSQEITSQPRARELDMLLTTGERISVALLSMALERLHLDAVSYTGSQVGIITDTRHTDARILEVKNYRIKEALREKKVPVVCGFQGVSTEKEITTLGRGGSDTTALALSAALNAEMCVIYTDVDGVFTEDPHQFPGVKKIRTISYEEMLELSCRGAQVLHPRACRVAARFTVPVEIRNSFNKRRGTFITDLGDIERPRPKAITHSDDLYLVTLMHVPKRPQYLSQIITELTHCGVHLKFFFHGIADAKKFDLSFITPLDERKQVKALLTKIAKRLRVNTIRETTDICSVSVIGRGISAENDILSDVFTVLSKSKIHIEAITTSELSINIFLRKKYLNKAIQSLLSKFHLKGTTHLKGTAHLKSATQGSRRDRRSR
jgi:aspartate kinase